jgi:CheY-like chemotaxis protein
MMHIITGRHERATITLVRGRENSLQGTGREGRRLEELAPLLQQGYTPFRGAAGRRAVSSVPGRHAQTCFFPLVPGAVPMSQRIASSLPIAGTAWLLAKSEEFAVIDRRALRSAGVGQVRVLTSGVQAVRFLAGKEPGDRQEMPDLVLANQQLEDMTGADFVTLVRSHPRQAGLPILYVSSSEAPEEKITALAQGYSGLLVRPYSGESMRLALEFAAAVKRDREQLGLGQALLNTELFDKALERFEALLGDCGQEPEKALHSGLEQLRQRKWDTAISAFQQALKQLAFRGEAEFGLALAWKGKGDQGQYRHYLERAGHSFAQAAKWHRARVVYARLLQEAPLAESPFLLEAERLIRAGQFTEAASALAEGYELTPKGAIRERLARTLIYNSDAPEQDADALRRSLRSMDPEVADRLSEEVREEMGEHKRRMQERKLSVQSASRPMFARGVPLLAEPAEEEAEPRQAGLAEPDSAKAQDSAKAIEPLSENSVMSGLFSGSPGVNEAITVAKLTWKIFRRGKL